MNARKLGRSGIETPPLVFGGNVFGWTVDEATGFRILDAFLAAGFNAVDTADVYSKWVPGVVVRPVQVTGIVVTFCVSPIINVIGLAALIVLGRSWLSTFGPVGGVPVAVPRLVMLPASTSAWVVV